MTDHAGPLRSECPPGTKLWRPPAFVTQFWHLRSGFGTRFRFARLTKLNSSEREKYETKVVGNGSSYYFVSYFSPLRMFFGLTKTEMDAKTIFPFKSCTKHIKFASKKGSDQLIVYREIQPVSYKRYFRCNNCFLLLVYTINLSLSTYLVDPPPMKTFYMKHTLDK